MSKKVFDAEDIAAVTRVLESGVLSAGPEAVALELEFAAALGADHAISCNAAMAGLHAALWAVGVGAGDEVVCDPLVLFGGLAVLYTGAMPVFADVHEHTHNMDPASLAERITPRTKAIIVTHHWGEPADMAGILAVADAHRLPVIEDCAHVLFGEWQGRTAGTLGSVGVFSFQSSKHLSTGDGGIAVTNDPYLAEQMRAIITFGAAPTRLAHNFRMTEMTAAVARVQLRRARGYVAEDRASAPCSMRKPQKAARGSSPKQRARRVSIPTTSGWRLLRRSRAVLHWKRSRKRAPRRKPPSVSVTWACLPICIPCSVWAAVTASVATPSRSRCRIAGGGVRWRSR